MCVVCVCVNVYIRIYIYVHTRIYVNIKLFLYFHLTCSRTYAHTYARAQDKSGAVDNGISESVRISQYGVASICRLLKIIGLFCKRAL